MVEENRDQGALEELAPAKETSESTDPGQFEGMSEAEVKEAEELSGQSKKDDDKTHEPKEGSPRWNEVYHDAKEGKRQVTALQDKLTGLENRYGVLETHNKSMDDKFKTLTDEQASSSKLESEESFNIQMSELRTKRDEAYDSNDPKAASRITDKISDLTMARTRQENAASVAASGLGNEEQNIEEKINSAVRQKTAEDALNNFQASTPWFDTTSDKYDPAMAGAASAIDEQIGRDPNWNTRPMAIQYAEVKRRVETRFGVVSNNGNGNGNGSGNPGRPLMPNVGGVGVGGGGEGGTGVKQLTADERTVARGLFPGDPNAELKYAAQK